MDKSSSITVTERSDRSLYMSAIQHILYPFNTAIIKPRKVFPAGSNQLTPRKATRKQCDVQERKVEDVYIYDITRKRDKVPATNGESKGRRRRIYFFNGGAWQMIPSSQHWGISTELASKLPNTTISLVSYPLAPQSPAPVAFPQLLRMYEQILREADEAGEQVIFAGDSSGGNIVLCLVLAALQDDPEHARCPSAIMAISPSCDLREFDKSRRELEKHDPILRIRFCEDNANKWRGDWNPEEPRVTPILGDVSVLARRGVKVHGVVAGYDILSPDARLFRDKCKEAGVAGEWLDWDKQMHVFPLAFSYRLRESREAVDWMLDVLKRS